MGRRFSGPANHAIRQGGERRRTLNDNMKPERDELSLHYVAALRKHLRRKPGTSLRPALRLGRQAVALGLETLELARMHERALLTLKVASQPAGQLHQAERFFDEALTPIVETHQAARRSKVDLNRLSETLGQKNLELADNRRQLQRGVLRRKGMEATLKRSGDKYTRLLKDSLLPDGLRHLTHQILLAQESERQALSHQLQDQVAQILLGINVRLLVLKQAAKGGSTVLTKEITDTQRLVADSIRTINRFARELELHQET